MLENLGVEPWKIRSAIEFIIGRGKRKPLGGIEPTSRTRKVLDLAADEARRLGHRYIGTEHILLGICREGESVPAGVLESFGIDLDRFEKARLEVSKILTGTVSAAGRQVGARRRQIRWGHTTNLPWDYLVIRTEWADGEAIVRSGHGPAGPHFTEGHAPLHEALALLGDDGWDLVGIDPSRGEVPTPGALYVFKRRRHD
jgi:hypothetical protein